MTFITIKGTYLIISSNNRNMWEDTLAYIIKRKCFDFRSCLIHDEI